MHIDSKSAKIKRLMHPLFLLAKLRMRGFVSLLSHISCIGDLLGTVISLSSGQIVWFSVSYSRYTDALFTAIFAVSEAAFAAASHNVQ